MLSQPAQPQTPDLSRRLAKLTSILDVAKAGFLDGEVYVPGFVLDELGSEARRGVRREAALGAAGAAVAGVGTAALVRRARRRRRGGGLRRVGGRGA